MNKEPWLAVCLSMIFPGLGQIYAGGIRRGLIIAFLGAWNIFLFIFRDSLQAVQPKWLIGIVFLGLIFWCWNLWDAFRFAKSKNPTEINEQLKRQKDPWLATLLSLICPGLGQIYLGPKGWGWVIVLTFLISAHSTQQVTDFMLGWSLSLLESLSRIFSMVYAYKKSPVVRKPRHTQHNFWLGIGVISLMVILSSHANLSFLARSATTDWRLTYVSTSISQPAPKIGDRIYKQNSWRNYGPERSWREALVTGGMSPTFQEKEILQVDRTQYWFKSPARNDIVVFNPPLSPKNTNVLQDYQVQRIIGLPGETIEFKSGQLLINHRPIQEPKITPNPQYNFETLTLNKTQYIVLGDNRLESFDSREWGALNKNKILGKVILPPEN